ncbi:MAG TPA: hypothetical protein VNQ33_10200 [Acidimicrobiales bacterium]|nr:hypothetical protein [Acidimicrobiales bacterium]
MCGPGRRDAATRTREEVVAHDARSRAAFPDQRHENVGHGALLAAR